MDSHADPVARGGKALASARSAMETAAGLRAQITDTRSRMHQTLDEIQERLRPGHIAGNVKRSMREATTEHPQRVAAALVVCVALVAWAIWRTRRRMHTEIESDW